MTEEKIDRDTGEITDYQPHSADIGELAAALAKAQGGMSNAAKDKTNPFFKSNYADLASIMDACRAVLSENALAVVQTTELGQAGWVVVVTTLMHSSGQWIRGRLALMPVKPDPQGVGSAITYGRRYGLQAIVGIAADDDDGNAASGRAASKTPTQPARAAGATTTREAASEDTHEKSPPAASSEPTHDACEVCGKPMKLRERKDGSSKFWGCTGYPACNFTDKYKEPTGPEPPDDSGKAQPTTPPDSEGDPAPWDEDDPPAEGDGLGLSDLTVEEYCTIISTVHGLMAKAVKGKKKVRAMQQWMEDYGLDPNLNLGDNDPAKVKAMALSMQKIYDDWMAGKR